MVLLEVIHNLCLMVRVDQGHDPFVDSELLEVSDVDLVLHVHHGVADAVDVVLAHDRSCLLSPRPAIIPVAASGLEALVGSRNKPPVV